MKNRIYKDLDVINIPSTFKLPIPYYWMSPHEKSEEKGQRQDFFIPKYEIYKSTG